MKSWLLLFVCGGVAATLCDAHHVLWGVVWYPGGGQPWWVFLLMGTSSLVLVGGYKLARLGETSIAPRDIAGPGAWFLGTYLATGPFAPWPYTLAMALLATFLWRVRDEPARAWFLPLGAMLGGSVVEATISGAGLFSYLSPVVWKVPAWLPFLYLHVGLSARAIARAMP